MSAYDFSHFSFDDVGTFLITHTMAIGPFANKSYYNRIRWILQSAGLIRQRWWNVRPTANASTWHSKLTIRMVINTGWSITAQLRTGWTWPYSVCYFFANRWKPTCRRRVLVDGRECGVVAIARQRAGRRRSGGLDSQYGAGRRIFRSERPGFCSRRNCWTGNSASLPHTQRRSFFEFASRWRVSTLWWSSSIDTKRLIAL